MNVKIYDLRNSGKVVKILKRHNKCLNSISAAIMLTGVWMIYKEMQVRYLNSEIEDLKSELAELKDGKEE